MKLLYDWVVRLIYLFLHSCFKKCVFDSLLPWIAWMVFFLACCSFFGCGYTFQNSKSPLFEKEGIHKIYITPLVNTTYKAGVENVVFNELTRALNAFGRVQVVQNLEDADALLSGSISTATYAQSGSTSVSGLTPQIAVNNLSNPPPGVSSNFNQISTFPISTEYTATLSCSFQLAEKTKPQNFKGQIASGQTNGQSNDLANDLANGLVKSGVPSTQVLSPALASKKKLYTWNASFSRAKPFPAANQIDVPGTTSPLINESEFERALFDLAHSMMLDVRESMLAMF